MRSKNTRLHFDNLFLAKPFSFEQFMLYQTGDCLTRSGFEAPEHRQVCDEISYIVSGEADFYLNGCRYPLQTGDLFFCPSSSTHRIVSSVENPVRYYYLGYKLVQQQPAYSRWKEIDEALHALSDPVCHRAFNMNHLFSDLLCEFQQDFHLRDRMIEVAVSQIILHTYKYYMVRTENAAVYEKRIPDHSELAYEMVNFIDNNVLRLHSLNDVSTYIGFSYSYTAQIFSEVMHQSLNDYYQKRRFEEAVRLLKSGMPITKTAEILGFDTVHSFSRAFKSRFGCAPRQYLQENSKS